MANQNQAMEFDLDMNAEAAARQQKVEQDLDSATSTEIAARIGQLMREQGIDEEANPMAAEKIARDLNYQRQIEQFPQPNEAPKVEEPDSEEVSRLEKLQADLEAAKKETAKWKTYYGRSESRMGDYKNRLSELEQRVAQVVPTVDVRQITGKEPGDVLTAQDIVNLMMAQSQSFGTRINQVKEEMVLAIRNPAEDRIPAEVEAELIQAHPWIANLPLPQKERAMSDLLGAMGRPVSNQPAPQVNNPTATLPESARAQVRQAAFIEPSNRGSVAEQRSVIPERQAFNEKIAKYREALNRPGGSKEAVEILASLGAGIVDETQIGYTRPRR